MSDETAEAASPSNGGPGPDQLPEQVRARPRDGRGARRRKPAASGPLAWLRETAIIVVSAVVLSVVVKTFLVQAFFIPSDSMNDTLIVHDRILVSKLVPRVFSLHRGDIVVFKDPGGWLPPTEAPRESGPTVVLDDALRWIGLLPTDSGDHLVKRVIGLPGDHVACAGAGSPVTVNGVPITETYLKPGSQPSEVAFDVVVPDGYLWVMGDNRQHSADSRYNQGRPGGGAVPVSDVVGVAFVTVWPLDRLTTLPNPGAVFASVPDPS
ncbi:signal peptidase I [Cellulomonas citrea]|uniref:signal peptidase I n=1 Tax=Cellulomonas citrea TaxID=1909423 RepID=UPI0013574614|nr:signal peptidase I [Cellulomonas citrea]